jgi:hypothetical protein
MRPLLPFLLAPALVATAASCGDNETPPPAKGSYEAGAPLALSCVPNLDGKIEARELAPAIGVPATYLVSPADKTREVDLVGAVDAQGRTTWRFGADYADDQVAHFAAQKLEGTWFAGSFAGLSDAFVVPIDAGGTTLGVYTHDEQELSLHGVASAVESPPEGKTLLVYDTPIAIYEFPLAPGKRWSTTSETRNATLRGLPYAGRDTYDVSVDGSGTVTLPDLVVTQAMRVRTHVTIVPAAGQTTTEWQTGFVFECLGEVVRATSALNEPNQDFTTARELRRFGLAPP